MARIFCEGEGGAYRQLSEVKNFQGVWGHSLENLRTPGCLGHNFPCFYDGREHRVVK